MNTRPINVLSTAIGALALSLVLVSSGASAPLPATQRVFFENVLDMNSWPNPKDMVVIREGTPLVVPAEKILVFTGLGGASSSGAGELCIDGVAEVKATNEYISSGGFAGNATTVKLLPPGLSAQAGSVVEVDNGAGAARAWGYLVDA